MLNYRLLRQKRREKEITIAEMSKHLGFKTPAGYWHIEQGHTKVSVEQLLKLSEFLGIPLGQLAKEKDEEEG
jgi:transcriptional regulator with XRE-family HTH domain